MKVSSNEAENSDQGEEMLYRLLREAKQCTRRGGVALCLMAAMATVQAAPPQTAPDFHQLATGATVVIMPVDVELFSMSAGGLLEPKADWTAAATDHIRSALEQSTADLGVKTTHLKEEDADEFAEQITLFRAVADSISLHHFFGNAWALPSKEGQLNWSFDDAMKGIQQSTGARYGLFTWVRDSYASAERKTAMVVAAMFGVGLTGGTQMGYASLVDLETGQVVWFNRLARNSGDLRELAPATESVQQLMVGLPKP